LTTFPPFRHRVQTFAFFGVTPFTRMRTLWMLGLKRRGVARIEWLRLLPNWGLLPQTLQIFAIETGLLGVLGCGGVRRATYDYEVLIEAAQP
jgi:hypothetical protein